LIKVSRFPDSLVLIFSMIVLAQIGTYFLPAGEFDHEVEEVAWSTEQRVTLPEGVDARLAGEEGEVLDGTSGRTIVLPSGSRRLEASNRVKPGSYHSVVAEPLPWHAFLTLIPRGMAAAADIIFFVFIVGGVIAIVRKTGAIDAVIAAAIRLLGTRPLLLVAGMVSLFAVGSSTIGMAEEYMPFIPILVAMCLALEMDAIVAMGIVYIGAGVGYGCAALNPFTVAIAKDIAGVDLGVGMWARWGLLAVMVVIGVEHVMRYARRVKRDRQESLVADVDYTDGFDIPADTRFTTPRIVILSLFAVMIVVFVVGVQQWDWYLTELAGLFLGLALLVAVVARMSGNTLSRTFCAGAAQMTTTALLIGFARTIEVVLKEGRVIDTVVHSIAQSLEGMPSWSAAVGMLGVQTICNFLVPSGSGQAYVTMPIMAPLADLTHIGRETAIFAYQFGDGLTNMIVPTNALLMGMLALGKIPFQRWVRFILPLLLKLYIVAVIALVIAANVYGH